MCWLKGNNRYYAEHPVKRVSYTKISTQGVLGSNPRQFCKGWLKIPLKCSQEKSFDLIVILFHFCCPCLCSVHIISKKKMIMCCLQRYWQEGSLSKSLFFQIFCIFQPRDSKEEENNVLFAEGIDRKSGEHRSHFSVTVSLDFNFCIWKFSEILHSFFVLSVLFSIIGHSLNYYWSLVALKENIARIANAVQVTLWLSVNHLNRCLCSHCSQCLLVSTSVY